MTPEMHFVNMYISYTVCPRIEFTREKQFLFVILRKNLEE
jgi:hypothetical protein